MRYKTPDRGKRCDDLFTDDEVIGIEMVASRVQRNATIVALSTYD